MISFVFCTFSGRIDNLLQTLRFLERNEPLLQKEIIVIFQDSCPIELDNCLVHNLNIETYQKTLMCNYGIKQASNPIVALLDSDRILPENYFYDNIQRIKRKEFITTIVLKRLVEPYDDCDILEGNYITTDDYKSTANEFRRKNLFSGNTLFYKDDYLQIGGMDEQYKGYGFADNDMTQNVISNNMIPVYLEDEELHLFHIPEILYEGNKLNDFQIFTAINAMIYARKWGKTDPVIHEICQSVISKINVYPENLQEKFKKIYKKLYVF